MPKAHLATIKAYMNDRAFSAKAGREQITARDIGRLGPGQWLNDEIINYWGTLLMERAARWKKKGKEAEVVDDSDPDDPGRFGFNDPLPEVHYLNTFFFAKLENPGYDAARLGKWTKTVRYEPGSLPHD